MWTCVQSVRTFHKDFMALSPMFPQNGDPYKVVEIGREGEFTSTFEALADMWTFFLAKVDKAREDDEKEF